MKKEKTPLKKLIKRDRYLILMVMPCVLYFLIFHYVPMVWNIVAFQDYNVRKGILGSSWVGLENFKRFFESPYAFRLIRNTFMLSFMDLILGFPVPILFALDVITFQTFIHSLCAVISNSSINPICKFFP